MHSDYNTENLLNRLSSSRQQNETGTTRSFWNRLDEAQWEECKVYGVVTQLDRHVNGSYKNVADCQ